MTQESHISRYRPAVLAITGVAAACSIYLLYEIYFDRPVKTSLHRSNAIRHRHREPTGLGIEETRPAIDLEDTINEDSDEVTFAETENADGMETHGTQEPSQGLKGLLYHIAETDAKRKAYEHRGIHCEECGERPILGIRWHCLNCPDFDLCATCETSTEHPKTHVFGKIKVPLPVLSQPTNEYPLWYPGDPRKIHPALRPDLKKRLQDEYDFDGPQMDANYDQFTCFANVPWPSDPNHVKAAIDRRAFNKALTSERWPQRFRPNAVYDRMFAFYDTNNDSLIGFEEFVSGLAYLRGPKRFKPLHRALQGFDLDGDGYVERKDFIRLFRAKHEIQKLIINDMIEGQEAEQTRAAMETIRSSQPISSVFSIEEIPPGEVRPRTGKVVDAYGDMQPLPGTKTILEDDEDWPDDQRIRHNQDEDAPLNQDILWQIVEEGFHEMVDPLFKVIEQEHQEAIDTREERQRWREEIDEAARQRRQKKVLWKDLSNGASVDPLMATALHSFSGEERSSQSPGRAIHDVQFRTGMVPTDPESLSRREAEITHRPLEELLLATGYSVVDENGLDQAVPNETSSKEHRDSQMSAYSVVSSFELSNDPTMPQNRPNASPTAQEQESTGKWQAFASLKASEAPSSYRLKHLARLDERDREIRDRRGSGKLSFEEIEELVRSDSSKELRGLVINWLEWASF